MGTVVKLEKPARQKPSGGKTPRRRPRRSRTALVLGGGGVTGGVYEIGALRALDLLATNRTVNQFDVYVGTSAGSFVAALAANGVTPEEMMRVVNQQVPTPFRDINMGTVLRPNYTDFAKALALMPLRAGGGGWGGGGGGRGGGGRGGGVFGGGLVAGGGGGPPRFF